MSRRTKREMAPPPHQAGALPPQQTGAPPLNNHGGSAPLSSTINPGDLIHPHLGSQPAWWPGPLPQANSSGMTSANYAMDCYPPGGFMSYFQTGQQPPIPPHVQLPAPWPTMGKEIQLAPPSSDLDTQDAKARPKGRSIVNIDDGNDVRTAKRLVFEPDEDLRLVSAWLFHSNDPISGNCKKNESYWADVHELYNSTTPTNRKRQVKHLKDRWQKIKRWVGFFCPTAWKGQFTTGRYGVPTIILEAVASYDLHIWHAFFGVAGSNNDINVLNQSPLFTEVLKGEAPRVQFSVNGKQYNTGYFLADGIYPEWAAFVKSIKEPQIQKHKVFAKQQEGARKACFWGAASSLQHCAPSSTILEHEGSSKYHDGSFLSRKKKECGS